MSYEKGEELINALSSLPDHVKSVLALNDDIKRIAENYRQKNNFLYLGRGVNFPVALEGALKLKEISYIHAEGYPAAEMKHGPIALIDESMPVVVIAPQDSVYSKITSNLQEIKARKGQIIAVATEGDVRIRELADEVIYLPKVHEFSLPILSIIPLQLLAYHMAVRRGCDVDQPRNLAKSVTVE
jgi:glucosamine--fructose-6-phosphate aminotransferase (isomerizing)